MTSITVSVCTLRSAEPLRSDTAPEKMFFAQATRGSGFWEFFFVTVQRYSNKVSNEVLGLGLVWTDF